jgi:murein DD-endopeptidase MepM/ murein hydrolase activator NlpD
MRRCAWSATLLATTALLAAHPPRAGADTWSWPLPGPHEVVRGFDPPLHPWDPGRRGVDLAARPGEAVRAAGTGVVRFAGVVAGVATVSVAHPGGLLTTYQPVRASVHVGDVVAAGALIGRVAASGSRCPPGVCLHWGLRRGADYLDPLALVGVGTVRLLPSAPAAERRWLTPAIGGASVGSSSTVVAWALLARRRRCRPPAGVTSLDDARRRREEASGVIPTH